MKKLNFGFNKIYFLNLIIIISFDNLNSLSDITLLKLGIKNNFINFTKKLNIYKINTNFININISINNFTNIAKAKISEQINSESSLVNNCSYSNNYFCYCKLIYIIFF